MKEVQIMKKLISIILILVMLSALAVCTSADEVSKARLLNAAKNACPTQYHDRYLGIAQNIIDQIDVSADNADAVIGLLGEGSTFISTNKGPSLDKYSAEEIAKAVDLFNAACEELSITTEWSVLNNGAHKGDMIARLYYDGTLIATLDGDDFKTSDDDTGTTGGGATAIRPTYTVEFKVAGGSEVLKIKVRQGGKIEQPEDPVKEGFVFGGWYSDEEFTKPFDFDAPITSKTTLYAKWIEETVEPDITDDPVVEWKNPYTDVDDDAWYYDAVKFADENGYMNGVGTSSFDPDGKLTRGMFVTMLYRIENTPDVTKESGFEDVTDGAWYHDAISWAAENSIVNGVSATEFKPNDYITREQMAAVIFRFAQYKGINAVTLAENLHFNDAGLISPYAVPAMNWAAGLDIIRGYGDGNVGPRDNTTRAQAALVLMRMKDNGIF